MNFKPKYRKNKISKTTGKMIVATSKKLRAIWSVHDFIKVIQYGVIPE